MLEGFSTNATGAKIRAIYSTMFTPENYRELMARKTVPECAEYLSRSERFRDAFREVDPNTVHRGFLEELLYRENFNTYIRLCRFQGLDKEPFYDFLLKRTVVENLLGVINNINSSLDGSYLRELPGYLVRHMGEKLAEVSRSTTYQELLTSLKGTEYYRILSRIPLREDGEADYVECERRLRNYYYAGLLQDADKVAGGGSELRELILREIDHRNIINAYRMKTYFGYTPEEIAKRSLSFTAVGKRTMERIYSAPDPEKMLEEISSTVYGRGSPETDNIEIKLNTVRVRRLRHKLEVSTSAPLSLYVFMQLCDIDVSNIVHIIEGIRYGAEPSVVESQLVC